MEQGGDREGHEEGAPCDGRGGGRGSGPGRGGRQSRRDLLTGWMWVQREESRTTPAFEAWSPGGWQCRFRSREDTGLSDTRVSDLGN